MNEISKLEYFALKLMCAKIAAGHPTIDVPTCIAEAQATIDTIAVFASANKGLELSPKQDREKKKTKAEGTQLSFT